MSSADSHVALEEEAVEFSGVGRKDGVRWYISTALRKTSSFFLFWRLLNCSVRLSPDAEEPIGMAEDEAAAPLRDTEAEALCEKARTAPLCKVRTDTDMA